MIPRRAALVAALPLLAGCASIKKIGTDTVCFDAVAFAFGLSDLQAIFNGMALFANRAAQAGLLSPTEMDLLVTMAEEAIVMFEMLKKQTLEAKALDTEALLRFLAKVAAMVAKVYGIPLPGPVARSVPPVTRQVPLIP